MTGGDYSALLYAAVLGCAVGFVLFWVLRSKGTRAFGEDQDPAAVLRVRPSGIVCNAAAETLFERPAFASLAEIAGLLVLDEEEDFLRWVTALNDGAGPAPTAGRYGDRPIRLVGYRAGRDLLIRVEDRSTEAGLEWALRLRAEEQDRLRRVLDGLPLPVWWRRPDDLMVLGGNAAYRRAVGQTGDQPVDGPLRDILAGLVPGEGTELARRALTRASQQSESHHVVIDGDRRLFDFVEQRLTDDGWTVGFGEDQTALEAMQASVGESIAANDAVLEQLLTAIAVFGPDRRLGFYNKAFRRDVGAGGTVPARGADVRGSAGPSA